MRPVIAIPKVLREKLGEDGADSLIEILNKSEERTKEDVIDLSAEKFERRLTEEISKVKQEISLLEGKFDKRLTEEISKVRIEMSKFKAEMIKWMFLFWIGHLACVAGLIKWLK